MKYCIECGGTLLLTIPPGDDRQRHVCADCDYIHYHNPKIITGCIPAYEDRVLLCRRAIEPRHGFWTLPAGFLENGETLEEGAVRETLEEACARVNLHELHGVFDIPHISQVYMFYRATLTDLAFSPGAESLETALFSQDEVPWENLAFPVITLMLRHYFADYQSGQYSLKTAKIDPKAKAAFAEKINEESNNESNDAP